MTTDTPARNSSADEVAAAAQQAAAAAAQLRSLDRAQRSAALRHVADALDAAGEILVPIADSESNLGPVRLNGELARTTGQLRLFATVIDDGGFLEATIDPAKTESTPPVPDVRRLLRSVGPVAVFAASNFPFAFSVAGGDTASALAAGCPVVVKAHPGHESLSAATAEIVAGALTEVGWPEGSFSIVFGQDAGRHLVLDPNISAVAFTGSLAGGTALLELTNSRPDPIPFYGELGSINPVIVTEAAAKQRAEAIGAGLAASFTMGVGQFCTKPGVVLIPSGTGIEDVVVKSLGAEAVPMLNARIASGFQHAIAELGASTGVRLLSGSHEQSGDSSSPVVFATTATELRGQAESMLHECFGPSTLLVTYEDTDDLQATIDVLPGSLTLTVQGCDEDVEWLGPLVSSLESRAGRLIWNGWPTGVAVNWAMQHGGPWPSSTTPAHTSVGSTAIRRFLRPVSYQDWPEALLPTEIRDGDAGISRRVAGSLSVPGES